ncbi:MAG TPA: SIS domain-containing protein [Rectinemataceae bacterium]|nr:SIS domain-containing protein [Rectinemataceae bacterium]
MNETDPRYSGIGLVADMRQVPAIVRGLDTARIIAFAERIRGEAVLLSGEGSSRIFPAGKVLADSRRHSYRDRMYTEACTQALEYELASTTVFVASNSGRTKEGVRLIRWLREKGCAGIIGVVAQAGTPIALEADASYILSCGPERAIAASKSVVEQALFYDLLFRSRNGLALPDLGLLAERMDAALRLTVPRETTKALAAASMLYWAGRKDGVAEELTLKTNEMTRKKSDYLEGTYAAHGIEEVMDASDAAIIVDPFPAEEQKFEEVLAGTVGLKTFAIAHRASRFPSLQVEGAGDMTPYVQLCAGWNLLVEVGIALGVNLDKPVRARKVGNEFLGA